VELESRLASLLGEPVDFLLDSHDAEQSSWLFQIPSEVVRRLVRANGPVELLEHQVHEVVRLAREAQATQTPLWFFESAAEPESPRLRPLQTPRLRLRHLQSTDVDPIVSMFAEPEWKQSILRWQYHQGLQRSIYSSLAEGHRLVRYPAWH
jgi:hypothetical protein